MSVKTATLVTLAALAVAASACSQEPGSKAEGKDAPQSNGTQQSADAPSKSGADSAKDSSAGPSADKEVKLPDAPIGTGFSAGITGPSARLASSSFSHEG